MTGSPSEHAERVRSALHAIVTEHGADTLSDAPRLIALMSDLLPDAPREAQVLLAAAEHQVAGSIRGHLAQGLDSATAVRLSAAAFAAKTMFASEVCDWIARELAVAMGLDPGVGESLGSTEYASALLTGVAKPSATPATASSPLRSALAKSPASGTPRRRWARVALTAVGALALACAAAVTVYYAASHLDRATASPPVASQSPGPSHAGRSAPALITRIVVYEPWTSAGLATEIAVHASIRGSCFGSSLTSNRDDAYRCISGNELYDPCFSDPYSLTEPGQVTCPYPALDSVTIIDLTAALPTPSTGQASSPNPWFVALTTGQQCWSAAGSAGIELGGLNSSFACTGGISLFGPPRVGRTWTIFEQAKGNTNLTPATIARAYE
jgi:hypothetical protein